MRPSPRNVRLSFVISPNAQTLIRLATGGHRSLASFHLLADKMERERASVELHIESVITETSPSFDLYGPRLSLSRYNGPNVRALRMPKYNQVMLSGWPLRADGRAPEIYCSVLMMHNAHSPISTVNREIGVRSTGTLLNTCWSTILPTVPDWPVHCRRRRVAIRGTISRCGNLRRWPRLRCTAPTLLGQPSPTGPPAPSAHFPPVPTLPLQTKKKKTKKKNMMRNVTTSSQ